MIKLHPYPDPFHQCPYCHVLLTINGWYIPGMRNLADLCCPKCEREYYGDLLSGHGLYYPMLLEKQTGIVHNRSEVQWFANWLSKSYTNRISTPIEFSAEEFKSLKHPILLNCLDTLYGHSLLKLLNAQYYIDHCPEFDLVILLPRSLRWMVPEGVAAIWTVNLPFSHGTEWNDWLAAEIERRIKPFAECWLSVAFPHPHPQDYDIERFTRVSPFPVMEWTNRLVTPVVTYIWREDRLWQDRNYTRPPATLQQRLKRWFGLEQILSVREEQTRRVITLANILRDHVPSLRFVIVGLGQAGGVPDWIIDLRTQQIDESTERIWCEQYAQTHVVVGVHGSNMLLPSAHAGAAVELVPDDRWGNLIQDVLPHADDIRESMYRYRLLPINTLPEVIAQVIISLLGGFSIAMLAFKRPSNDHQIVGEAPELVSNTRRQLVENLGKMYRIGTEEHRPANFWQATKQLAASPFDYLRRITRPPTEEETL